MLVKPAPGVLVRDPRTKVRIPDEGIDAPEHDLDFARLLADGDLVAAEQVGTRPDHADAGIQVSGETADGDHLPPIGEQDTDEEHA